MAGRTLRTQRTYRTGSIAGIVTLVLLAAHGASAQGPPDIVWMAGGHTSDGRELASAGEDGDNTVRLWRVSDGALLKTYDKETSRDTLDIQFAPDGRTFGYAREDGTIVMAYNPFQGELDCGVDVSLSTKCRNDGKRVIAKLKRATPGARVTFTIDSREPVEAIADERGKARVKYTAQPAGDHVVRACALEAGC